jgi:hypothetical protein
LRTPILWFDAPSANAAMRRPAVRQGHCWRARPRRRRPRRPSLADVVNLCRPRCSRNDWRPWSMWRSVVSSNEDTPLGVGDAAVRKQAAEIASALDRLIAAGLLFRQGAPPHASYLFEHALVQGADHGTLLRKPRRVLHARIAETLKVQFQKIAQCRPELLARRWTQAGLMEKAACPLAQSGAAVSGAIGAGQSCRSAHTCPRPDRDLIRELQRSDAGPRKQRSRRTTMSAVATFRNPRARGRSHGRRRESN